MLPVLLAIVLAVALATPASAETSNIFTVAGTGAAGFAGDGGAAAAAELDAPTAVAATADGGFLIADTNNQRIRRVSPQGVISTVAGDGTSGLSGDGGPATDAHLDDPQGVTATADGGFLIADSENRRVRRVSPAGVISTVAGGGSGSLGDGGPATQARISQPTDVALLADGGFLIADAGFERVRRVSPAGVISTVAGDGTTGSGGDGGPATAAQLNNPTGVAATADGGFLIVDSGNGSVRRVSPEGLITTVAGGNGALSTGDGGPAVAAQLGLPGSVATTPDGGFLVTELFGSRVRRVSPRGVITTVAGTGGFGFGGDGGPAVGAQLDFPFGVAVTASGGFLIADVNNDRVRFVDADLRGPDAGPSGAPGPAGPAGPPGPAGDPGPRGVIERLMVTAFAERLRARPRATIAIHYFASVPALVELRLLDGRRTVARRQQRAQSRRNVLRLRAPRRPGRYSIALGARAGDQRAADRTVLIVRRSRSSR